MEEKEGYFIATFKLRDHQDLINMRLSEKDYDYLKKVFLGHSSTEFFEIIPYGEREFFGWVQKSWIVHRSKILEISFGFQRERKNAISG